VLPGVKDLTQQLEDEQKQFKVAEGVWYNAQTEEDKTTNATAAKRELLRIINTKLVVYLRGMLQVEPETYQDLAARVELLIDKTNAAIKRRSAN
jgi:hypothetical protein